MPTEEEVLTKLAETLQVDRHLLTRDTKASDLPMWDSMGMVKLIFMLDEEFGLVLETEDAPRVQSVGSILDMLRAAGKLR